MRRLSRPVAWFALAIVTAVAVVAWSQTFLDVRLAASESTVGTLSVTGSALVPAFALAVTASFLAATLAILARPLARWIASALAVVLSAAALALLLPALIGDLSSMRGAIARISGVADSASQSIVVESSVLTPWFFMALLSSVIMVGGAAIVPFIARTWKSIAARYERRSVDVIGARGEHRTPETTWDMLDTGDDPTTMTTH